MVMTTVREYRLLKAADRGKSCDCGTCHYCDMPLAASHEHDHFPVPKAAGGREVVPVCLNCHDLKDRTAIPAWDATTALAALTDLSAYSWEDEDALPDRHDLVQLFDHDAVLRDWAALSPSTRLVYAKLRRVGEEAAL